MPIKYIPYQPQPVSGQAVLNNITRTSRLLSYRENNKVFSKIERGMPYYEVEEIEAIGFQNNAQNAPNSLPNNVLIRGECLSACAYLAEQNIKIDLVYIDPPFASGANYAKKIYIRKNPKLAEKVKEAEEQLNELEIEELRAFEETMYGDIWQKEDYLNWMYENLMAIKEVMSDKASIYVHLDWHIGHYVKILMDEVFGEENFVNEVIWFYRSGGASKVGSIARKHDSIYFFKKNENFQINTIYERQYLDKSFMESKIDENGRFYVDTILTDTINGIVNRVMEDGSIKEYSTRPVLNLSTERLDYSTQKPEGLLSILIEIATKEGDVVADFFGGSGVCAKVANDLNRQFIHCDIGINSIQTTRDRLKQAGANFKILEVKDGVSLFRNPSQTMDKLAKTIPNLEQSRVEGVSKFWFGTIKDKKDGTIPVYVTNLLNSNDKVLDIPTINQIINEELFKLPEDIKKVIIYYVDVQDQKELEKFIRDENNTQIEVELKDLKNLLHHIVFEDIIELETKKTKDVFEVEINKFISDRVLQKIADFNQKGNLQSLTKGREFKPINISENGLELIELIALDCKNQNGNWHSDVEIKIDKLGYCIKDGKKTKEFWNGKIDSEEQPQRVKIRNICGDETIKSINF